jgi:molybdate transport system substrate-binding protein
VTSRSLACAAILLIACLALAACGGDDAATPSPTPVSATTSASPAATQVSGDITVFAASSLTGAFTQIGKDFQAANPGAHVTFNFAGSQDLRTQMEQGASADVFASADTNQMGLAQQSKVVPGPGTIFLHNRLVIIAPKANSAGVTTPQDLAKPGVKLVIANENVPVGKYARQFLETASGSASYGSGYKNAVLANVVSEATNVKEVVSPVQLDEVDAGIVYVTDAKSAANDVTQIDIPDSVNQIANYPISLTTAGLMNAAAQAFIDYVTGAAGQATLKSFGFVPATAP